MKRGDGDVDILSVAETKQKKKLSAESFQNFL